jgi:hypothetical protein
MSRFQHTGFINWGELPEDVRKEYTINGQIAVKDWHIKESSVNKNVPVWNAQRLRDGVRGANMRENLQTVASYGPETIRTLYTILDRYPIAGKDVLVVGSQNPWIECISIAFGARSVTCVDFNPPIVEDTFGGKLRSIGIDQFKTEGRTYNVLISYSSIEHDGLGRYGDPINPNGDIERMEDYTKYMDIHDNLLLLGVPIGNVDQLIFNAHRIYGPVRLPLIIKHYNAVDVLYEGYPDITMSNIHTWNKNNNWTFQPWIVLECRSVFNLKYDGVQCCE